MTPQEQIFSIIARVAKKDAGTLRSEMQLVADLGIDSPRALELLCALEDELHIEIPEDAVGRISTVGDIVKLVAEQQ